MGYHKPLSPPPGPEDPSGQRALPPGSGPPGLKILVVVLLLVAAGLLVRFHPEGPEIGQQMNLGNVLSEIPGWQPDHSIFLEGPIRDALKLDDYLFKVYRRGDDRVTLYIGYYHTAKKVGAAHDPMVCFPGQGWQISEKKALSIPLPDPPGGAVHLSRMTARLSDRSETVYYWFQAHDQTSGGTFRQKLSLLWNRLRGRGEANAFVRVTVSMGADPAVSDDSARSFIQAFYPLFHSALIR